MSTELLPNIRSRFCDANGLPLVGGKFYSYEAGTTTPLATYTDQAATTPNTNPIILDANGEATIFITSGVQYKFMLTDADDVLIWSADNVSGVGFSGILGTGDVAGPSGSVNNEIALFSGTTGKVLKRASGTGFVKSTSGVIGYQASIDLATETTGVQPINRGGTGQTTAALALDALLPAQTGNGGRFLGTDGFYPGWMDVRQLPVGGTANQLLAKIDATDGNADWIDVPVGLPAGGATGEVLRKVSGADGDATWAASGLPIGGSPGDVLSKSSGADFDVTWAAPATAGPQIFGTRSSPTNISAGSGLSFFGTYYNNIAFIQGNGGPVTVTANPQIAAGTLLGQRLFTILRDATKPITWSDGNGLSCLGGPVVQDVTDGIAEWIWDGVNWIYKP